MARGEMGGGGGGGRRALSPAGFCSLWTTRAGSPNAELSTETDMVPLATAVLAPDKYERAYAFSFPTLCTRPLKREGTLTRMGQGLLESMEFIHSVTPLDTRTLRRANTPLFCTLGELSQAKQIKEEQNHRNQ